jgi:tRNA(His) 5'-end guanylyltransferase
MKADEFEDELRSGECFHSLRLLPGAWVVLRVDGHGFSRLTQTGFTKPFDPRFHQCMVETSRALLEEFRGLYAYTESDEISVLMPRGWALFGRELEKAVSIAAGVASAAFTMACGTAAAFDGRAWLGADEGAVIDYFRWRQADATRCALNGWCYWTLRQEGQSVARATAALIGQSRATKNELLFQRGINFNDLPAWQRRGTGLYRETYTKEGYDPKRKQTVYSTRRRLKVDEDLPMRDAYSDFLRRLFVPQREAQPG